MDDSDTDCVCSKAHAHKPFMHCTMCPYRAQVRTDVLVRAARLEDAVGVFLDAVLTALEDVAEVPVYFVNGVDILDPPHHTYQGDTGLNTH